MSNDSNRWLQRAMRCGLRFALTAVVGCLVLPAVADDAPYYEGRTIRIIVPFFPGGGTDTFGRLVGRYLGRHVPGEPTVIVENATGAGGLLGSNTFALRSPRDGTALLAASGHLNLRAFLRLRALRLDLAECEPLVAAPMGHVTAMHTRVGVTRPEDMTQAEGRITKGITDPIGMIESLLALELFDFNYRPVPGYGGRGDTRIAFERGELVINTQSTPAYLAQVVPLVEEGRALPLYALGFIDAEGRSVRDPAVPDLMTAPELYERIHGRPPSGVVWDAYKAVIPLVQDTRATIWMHADIPSAAKEALAIGVARMVRDPEFLAASERILQGYEIVYGADLDQIKSAMEAASPAALDYVRELLTTRFGTRFQE